jgi:aminoglycoside phosphotransferase family enzyme
VDVIETHYSWVLLTDRYAYKLKKPVQGEGFDFRSVDGRRRNAVAELRLNRRLAPDVYLRTVPLTVQTDGRLTLDGRGEPVDWLVQMVRLDADRMFDRRLARRDWRYGEIEGLAQRLARFFATAPGCDCRPSSRGVASPGRCARQRPRLRPLARSDF